MRLFVTASGLAWVFASCVVAQGASLQKPAAMRRTAEPPAGAPVVTIHGLCKEPQSSSACKTVISREDFDSFANAIEPGMTETARGRLAVQYARTLALSALAEQQGLDRNPVLAREIEAELKLVRMRILANAFWKSREEHAAPVTEAEVQKYYNERVNQYQEAQVLRLAVPLAAPTDSGRPPDRAAVKSEMDEVRRRAEAGEDLATLQAEAYKHLHIQAAPPPVVPLTLRRATIQGEEAKVFDLKPGEISPVLELPAAFVVEKLESGGTLPLESVRREIESALRRDRTQADLAKLASQISAKFDLQYLHLDAQPALFGPTTATSSAVGPSRPLRTRFGARR